MSILDDIDPYDIVVKPMTDGSPEPEDVDCDLSITIELRNSATFDCKLRESVLIIEANRSVDDVNGYNNIKSKADSNDDDKKEKIKDRVIFLKMSSVYISNLHKLVRAISQCITIKGGPDSFAIIKYFNGNFLSQKTTCLYEDFVTPGNTIDISRLDSLLKVITNKRTKI